MPNWSYTDYVLTGDKEQLDALYGKMRELEGVEGPLVPNGFGNRWLGNLVKALGGDIDKVHCRGHWSDLHRNGDDICFNCEHAWSRPDEVEELIGSVYPDIFFYYQEEELGMGIFQTNDMEHLYFSTTAIVDTEEDGMEYYNDEKAFETLSKLLGKKIADWEEAEELVEAHNDKADSEGTENHIWIHRIEYD